LLGGTKSGMGQRWMFDKPVTIEGVSLTNFYADDFDLAGTRIINWGFLPSRPPKMLWSTCNELLELIWLQLTESMLERKSGLTSSLPGSQKVPTATQVSSSSMRLNGF